MTKQLNESSMRSELTGSAFFNPPPKPVNPAQPKERPDAAQSPQESPIPSPTAKPLHADDVRLPRALEGFRDGYHNRSYRFTPAEIRWLKRFCLKTSEALDRDIPHNTMIRVLFRLADAEWQRDPGHNRLRELLFLLKD